MLSVVLATHNEEKNIERCLISVAKIADEMIVVDGESTDQTVKIAKKLGAKVISTTNKSNFHINKQMAMDAAKGKIILQLDADEEIDQELVTFIKKIKKDVATAKLEEYTPKAWYLKRKNYFLGKWLSKGGQYPDPVIRLYLNGYARLPQKDVHEQMSVDGEIGTAKGHLNHYPNPTFHNYLVNSFDRYTSFKAQQLYNDGIKLSVSNSLNYLIWKPITTFLSLYFRHRGYVDGVPGFIFAVFSGLHHLVAYLKLWEITQT